MSSSENQPERIGPYHILGKLGEGGFGDVYEGEQTDPVRRRVAVKILKRGMDTRAVLARFEAERQALALMDHPNIARILGAGATDGGRPYFVMDLIEGEPITVYCDRKSLSTRARAAIFVSVCEAVQHAHQKGVIHRDIKPSNLLVAEEDGAAVVKVIDFGIAKAIHSPLTDKTVLTMQGQAIGTPVYMSPEQAVGFLSVDTSTDVYSLGAVFYELLTGRAPFESAELQRAGPEAMARILREDEPSRPSVRVSEPGGALTELARRSSREPHLLRSELSGDLDWITMTAMEKDPDRRYASAGAFAADVQRFLRHDPVDAAPPSVAYRMKKFVRRHRVGVGVLVVAALVLVGFAGSMTVQARRIAEERDRANHERDSADRVADFLSDMMSTVEPGQLGASLWTDLRDRIERAQMERGATEESIARTLGGFDAVTSSVSPTDAALRLLDEEILARAGATIETELGGEPAIEARLHHTFGKTYRFLGLYEQSEMYLRRAIEQRAEAHGQDAAETLDSENHLSLLLLDMGRGEHAEANARSALARARESLGHDHPITLAIMSSLGLVLKARGKLDKAAPPVN